MGALAAPIPAPGDLEGPGGIPHYFGPYGNWAFSPLPKGPVAVVTPTNPGSGYTAPVVTIDDAYLQAGAFTPASVDAILGDGVIAGFTKIIGGSGYNNPLVTITDPTGTGANVIASVDIAGAIVDFTILNGGAGYTAPVVTITDNPDLCGTGTQPACGTGASASAVIGNASIVGFIIIDGGLGYTAPVVSITDVTGTGATADAVIGGTLTGGIHKFIDALPGLWDPRGGGTAPAKSIPLAVPDVVTYPGSHYYEIVLREFSASFHSSLPPTKLRGYVQINNGTANVYHPVTNPTGCVPPGQPLPTGLSYCTLTDNTVIPALIRYLGMSEIHRVR